MRLEEDAADLYGYKNAVIRKALEESYGAVLDIILGERYHPIVDMYNSWIKNRPRSIKLILQHHFNFTQQFSHSLIPGDMSLIPPLLLYLQDAVKDSKTLVELHWINTVGLLLFKLVVMRMYLGRLPCDDNRVFYLAYKGSYFDTAIAADDVHLGAIKGSLERILTTPERAAASSGSIQNIGIFRSLHRKIVHTDISGSPLIKALTDTNQPYTFFQTTAVGLTGGHQWVHNHRFEDHSERKKIVPTGERPKSRRRGAAAKSRVPDSARIIQRTAPAAIAPLKRPSAPTDDSLDHRRSKRLRGT